MLAAIVLLLAVADSDAQVAATASLFWNRRNSFQMDWSYLLLLLAATVLLLAVADSEAQLAATVGALATPVTRAVVWAPTAAAEPSPALARLADSLKMMCLAETRVALTVADGSTHVFGVRTANCGSSWRAQFDALDSWTPSGGWRNGVLAVRGAPLTTQHPGSSKL